MRKQYTAVIINDIKVVNRDPTILEKTNDLSFSLEILHIQQETFFCIGAMLTLYYL